MAVAICPVMNTESEAVTAVRPVAPESGLSSSWSLLETAYAEACAVQAGCEPGQASFKRPQEDLSGFLALLGG